MIVTEKFYKKQGAKMNSKNKGSQAIHGEVKKHYGAVADAASGNSAPTVTSLPVAGKTSCCNPSTENHDATVYSKSIGYSSEEIASVPEGANLGLGCGNPTTLASLKEGEVVIDLGSGAGFDAFLARQKVGTSGHVIGIDMTDEMLQKAKGNAAKAKFDNVEFRKGYIEDMPVEDNTADCVISNCVINLSPDKKKVFQEAYRCLKPGGRIMVSDIVLVGELSDEMQKSVEAYVGCIAGAETKQV